MLLGLIVCSCTLFEVPCFQLPWLLGQDLGNSTGSLQVGREEDSLIDYFLRRDWISKYLLSPCM